MRNSVTKAVFASTMLAMVGGCGGTNALDAKPLFFAQGITFGLTGGTAPQNGNTPEFTVGYKQMNVAIVPTVMKNVESEDANVLKQAKILAQDGLTLDTNGNSSAKKQDALSTFGSFEGSGKTSEVELGVFFATGVAASHLAEGFKCKLAQGKDLCAADDEDQQSKKGS